MDHPGSSNQSPQRYCQQGSDCACRVDSEEYRIPLDGTVLRRGSNPSLRGTDTLERLGWNCLAWYSHRRGHGKTGRAANRDQFQVIFVTLTLTNPFLPMKYHTGTLVRHPPSFAMPPVVTVLCRAAYRKYSVNPPSALRPLAPRDVR